MPFFVVQEHWATAHHFDFRLEMDGILKSWAVPKGVPAEPGVRHLAMEVEDHPLSYGSSEGTISRGRYGAGRVVIWDHGEYTLHIRDARQLTFTLSGEKVHGDYALVLFKRERGRGQWLLFKLGHPGEDRRRPATGQGRTKPRGPKPSRRPQPDLTDFS